MICAQSTRREARSTDGKARGHTVSPCLAVTAPPASRPISPVSSTICNHRAAYEA